MIFMRHSFILFFFLHFLVGVNAQEKIPKKPLELLLLSHRNANEVDQRSKVEIGFAVPSDLQLKMHNFFNGRSVAKHLKVNPFLEWELLVKATFTHLKSEKKVVRHGFYYRKMKRDSSQNYWKDVRDDFTLRVRFLPEEIGKWECAITVQEHGKTKYQSQPILFNVRPSSNPGYVDIDEGQRYFSRDGKIIVPTGINQPSPYVANNMIHNWSNKSRLNMESWKIFNEDVENYALQGGQFFRFFLMPSCSDIEFEELGNYYDRLNFAWEIDNMLAICEREDVLINFNMLYHTPFMRMADYHQFRWDYTTNWHDPKAWPYRDQNPTYAYSTYLNSSMPSDMFLNNETLKYAKQRVRYIISRWGYSTAIGTFEVMSEPWHVNEDWFHKDTPYDSIGQIGDQARKAAHTFHREIANYIKTDLNHNYQPVGAVGRLRRNDGEFFSHPMNPNFNYNDSTWFDENIDFISISYYSSDPSKMIISKKGKSNNTCESAENSFFCAVEQLRDTYNKPVLLGEADHGDGTHYCSELEGHYIDIMRYNLNGVAGHYVWRAFSYPHPSNSAPMDERETWPGIIAAQHFFNSAKALDVFEQYATQGREKNNTKGVNTTLKEHQYIIDSSANHVVGYIYNRSFNVHTAPSEQGGIENTNCYIENDELNKGQYISWKPKRMKVEGLKRRTNYKIKFYSYKTGEFLSAKEIKSSFFGNLTLEHPDLGKTKFENPLIWYILDSE
jgi:hypothetical protein